MGIFDFFKSNKEELDLLRSQSSKQSQELSDVKARLLAQQAETLSLNQFLKTKRTNLPKPLQYSSTNITGGGDNRNRQPFTGPVYDLSEITRALDVESYVAISVRKHREQILKEGFNIVGEDEKAVEYIKKRLFEFSLVSSISFEDIIREYTTNLVQYGTSFLVAVRDVNASSGNRIKWRGKKLDPMAAIFPMNPTTVGGQQNSDGHVVKWEQRIDSNTFNNKVIKKYEKESVIFSTIDKKTGFIFGTPYILPVLDDVRVLRRIEEIAEVVCQRHAFPWQHWKVGSDEFPADTDENGVTELDIIKNVITNTSPEGGIVTDHRVESKILGAEGHAIDLVPYLTYFEKRVMAGLRLSPEDLGRSEGSKGGAQTASETLQEASKDFQSVISSSITHQLFIPLLLEGGFDVTQDTLVKLEFKLINREEERARISHGNDLFLGGSLTRNEFRKEYLKKKEVAEEEDKDTLIGRKEKHDIELAKMAAQASAQKSQASKSTASAAKKANNVNRPKNQNGQKAAKTRIKANDASEKLYVAELENHWSDIKLMLQGFVDKLDKPISPDKEDPADVSTREDELKSILDTLVIFFSKDSKALLLPVIQNGARQAAADTGNQEYSISNRAIDRFIKNNITKSLKSFAASMKDEISNSDAIYGCSDTHPQVVLSGMLENRTEELYLMSSKQIDIAYRFGYAKTVKYYGQDSIILSPIEDRCCDECLEIGDRKISMLQKDIPYNTLLYSHSDCEFEIKI